MATADPWADPNTDAANESDGEFLTNDELIGRHVLIVPKSIETIPGEGSWPDGRVKTDYERITADIIVLDGRRDAKIKAFPHIERNKYVSAFKVVKEIKQYVKTETPVLGYWTKVGNAFFLEKADPEASKLAGPAWQEYAEPPF